MTNARMHYPSFFSFLLCGVGLLLFYALGFILGMSALFMYLSRQTIDVPTLIYATTMFFLGTLVGVAAGVSLLKLMNKPAADAPVFTGFRSWHIAAGVLGAGLALLAGTLTRANSSANWLTLPLLTIPAVMLPIWTITALAARNLPAGSRWRTWSVFGFSLTVTPFLLVVLEVIAVVALLLIVGVYAAFNPQIALEFERLSTQFSLVDVQSEEALRLLAPYLTKPGVVISVILFFCVFIPLAEELLKPLAVWILARRLDSAAQGFVLGALSGAGFAVIETINVSRQAADWGVILTTRIGTGLLHITTSALMGAAIYGVFRERRVLNLLGTYLLAVLLHGLWNASALTTALSAVVAMDDQSAVYVRLQWGAFLGLAVLAGVLLALLAVSNRRLTPKAAPTVPEETPAPPPQASL